MGIPRRYYAADLVKAIISQIAQFSLKSVLKNNTFLNRPSSILETCPNLPVPGPDFSYVWTNLNICFNSYRKQLGGKFKLSKVTNLMFVHVVLVWLVKAGFFLDAFSANCVFDFAETLSFCLEFWVFYLELLSFFLNYFEKQPISPHKWTIFAVFQFKIGYFSYDTDI